MAKELRFGAEARNLLRAGVDKLADDDAVGAAIAKALHTVGDDGTVTVEESAAHGMSVELVEGFEFDSDLSPTVTSRHIW